MAIAKSEKVIVKKENAVPGKGDVSTNGSKKAAKPGEAVKPGDKVNVEYEGKLEDGTVFDSSSRHGQMLEFEVGAGRIIKGFDNAVVGMKRGEEKTIKIPPEEAYGQPNPMLIQKMPRANLPKEPEPKEGMMLIATLPTGEQIPARITAVDKATVILDFNHPLAGKTLTFKIKIVDIEEGNVAGKKD